MKNAVKFANVDKFTWSILFNEMRTVTGVPAHDSIVIDEHNVITDVPDEFFPENMDWTGDAFQIHFIRNDEGDKLVVVHFPLNAKDDAKVWELDKPNMAKSESLETAETKCFTLQTHPDSRRGIYWDPQWSPWIFKRPNKVYNSDNDLWEGLQDLDRRFTQLWDKQHSESYELLQKFLTIMQQLHPEKAADELIHDLVADEFGWFKEYGQKLGNFEGIVYGNIPVNNKEEFEFWYKLAMELKNGE